MSCIEGVCYLGTPLAPSRAAPRRSHKGRRGIGGLGELALAPSGDPSRGDQPGEAACDACGPHCACEPCRAAHAPSAGVPMPPPRPRLVLAPAGMPSAPSWAELTPTERRDLVGAVIDRAIDTRGAVRPAGNPPPANANANADALPDWARGRGITQTQWTAMSAEAREAERQRYLAASGQGWQTASTIITQASTVVNQVLRGDLERDLERIRQQGALGAAQQQAAAQQFVAQTNLRIAELNAAAAANPAGAQQFQQAIAALQAAQNAAQGNTTTQLATILQQMRQTVPAITPNTILVGVGILGALGVAAAVALRR